MNKVEILNPRRNLLKALSVLAVSLNLPATTLLAASREKIIRKIPSSNKTLAVMGVGSSRTFDINTSEIPATQLVELMQHFFDDGGQLVDSSPMYGNAETVIGELIKQLSSNNAYFAATKVWTDGKQQGIEQMNSSMKKMGVEVMDLIQIHNLRDWQTHIQTLNEWKEQGKIRYTGITTSHGRNHDELVQILKMQELDFVQFTYNILDREAEKSLLPLARDKGIGVIVNVPFQSGKLFQKVKGKVLPSWAAEFDCVSWGQFFLKFIASHPDVTNIIPATTKLKHMADNMAAGYGRLPDPDTRERMINFMES